MYIVLFELCDSHIIPLLDDKSSNEHTKLLLLRPSRYRNPAGIYNISLIIAIGNHFQS